MIYFDKNNLISQQNICVKRPAGASPEGARFFKVWMWVL